MRTLILTTLVATFMAAPQAKTSGENDPISPGDWQEQRPQGGPRLNIALSLTTAATLVPIVVGANLYNGTSDQSGFNQSAGLILGGLLFGPSAGQFYAGAPGTAVIGIGMRTLGTAMFVGGLRTALTGCQGSCGQGAETRGSLMVVGGLLTFLAGTGYSFYQTSEAVDSWHRRNALALAPTLSVEPDGALTAGVSAALRF